MLIFTAAYFAYSVSWKGWVIMSCMFFASMFDYISRKCFEIAKKPKFYIEPVTKDMIDENGNIKKDYDETI